MGGHNQGRQRKPTQTRAKGCDLNWIFILRVCGGVTGVVLIAVAIYIMATLSFDGGNGIKTFMNAFYEIIAGILVIMCEARWVTALIYFRFLIHPFGIGMYYVFVGGLALGSDWWQYVLAIIFWSIGLVYMALWCCGRTADLNIPQPNPPQGQIKPKEMGARAPKPPPQKPNDRYGDQQQNNDDGWTNAGGGGGGSGGAYGQTNQYVSPANNNPYSNTGQNYNAKSQAGGKVNPNEHDNPFDKQQSDNPFE